MNQPQRKLKPIMLSKRANVFYLEHVRVMQLDYRVVYLTQNGGDIEEYFNIPERNTAFILLGKGSSITDSAARHLAECNIMVGFCGSGGSPLFGALDLTFLAPQSEYRPTEYMQAWMIQWLDVEKRLQLGKQLLLERVRYITEKWQQNPELQSLGIALPEALQNTLIMEIEKGTKTQDLLLAEARFAKNIYAMLAKACGFTFNRDSGKKSSASKADICNGFLDHGNYIAYGYATVALCGLGISFALPVLHGKTRRGALVFDVADLIKDAIVMPLAFYCAKKNVSQKDFRKMLIERCQKQEVLDYLFDFIISLCNKSL